MKLSYFFENRFLIALVIDFLRIGGMLISPSSTTRLIFIISGAMSFLLAINYFLNPNKVEKTFQDKIGEYLPF